MWKYRCTICDHTETKDKAPVKTPFCPLCDNELEWNVGDPVDVKVLAPKDNLKDKKAKVSLLPMDILIEFVVPAYEEGVAKYERESHRRGFQTSTLIDSTMRHINSFFYEGEDLDPDAVKNGVNKHHLAGAIFSLLSILHDQKYHPELDDRRSPVDGSLLKEHKDGEEKEDV